MSYPELPLEILLMIVEELHDRKDLQSICLVSKALHAFTMPKLYNSVHLTANENRIDRINTDLLHRTLSNKPEYAKYIKKIKLSTAFKEQLDSYERCIHFPSNPGNRHFYKFGKKLKCLLQQLDDDSLEGFIWELGTCVPAEVLGQYSILVKKQRAIRSIELLTVTECIEYNVGYKAIQLSSFKHLRRLSWKGMRGARDFAIVYDAICGVSEQLTELELECLSDSAMPDLMGHFSGKAELRLRALKLLSLSNIDLGENMDWLMKAFNIARLNSLTLTLCENSTKLLLHAVGARKPLARLKSFEITADQFDHNVKALEKFLALCTKLEEIKILHHGPTPFYPIWRAVLLHQATLKSFIYHQRKFDDYDEHVGHDHHDCRDLSFRKRPGVPFRDEMCSPLGELNVEFIGLCAEPRLLKSILEPFAEVGGRLKLLHIRRSAWDYREITRAEARFMPRPSYTEELRDVYSFTNWAFGPQGIKSLQVVVFGDFSNYDRYAEYNTSLCRNEVQGQLVLAPNFVFHLNAFRKVTKDDHMQLELIDCHSSSLRACPTTPLFTL